MKCPTCGHIHPCGIGVDYCMCDDCFLVWHARPELLCKESRIKRDKLIEKVEASHEQ